MWKWLEPIECRIAQQCLAHGQTLEAARHLLAGSHREHRAVRDLLLRIGPELVAQARQAFDAGDVAVAGELIACAAQCGELPPAARALQQEIVRLCQRQQQDQHWRQDRLRTAEQWARQGRLYSAIGLVEPLADDDATAARRKQDWAADAARLTLNDGDVLQFGNEHCRWTFRQPETDACRTLALLHQTRPASACAVATDGTQVRCVVLAADELAIGRDRAAAHLVEPGLPIRQLRLAWRADGLYADAIGGMLFVNGAAADVDAGVPVGLPAELAMYADGNGLVGEALLGAGGLYEMKLDLRGDPHA